MTARDDYEKARKASPYSDDTLVDGMTRKILQAGFHILQSHRLAHTDDAHVVELLRYLNPPPDAHILDVGCGAGMVAMLMQLHQPDLVFTLFNISPAQLRMAPPWGRVCGHMHDLPFADESFDAVMYNWSLGHGMLDKSLSEAARVLRPGGIVFAYELCTSEPELLVEQMGYRPHRMEEVIFSGTEHGLRPTKIAEPPTSVAQFIEVFGHKAFTDHGFAQCWPVIYRFTKGLAHGNA